MIGDKSLYRQRERGGRIRGLKVSGTIARQVGKGSLPGDQRWRVMRLWEREVGMEIGAALELGREVRPNGRWFGEREMLTMSSRPVQSLQAAAAMQVPSQGVDPSVTRQVCAP